MSTAPISSQHFSAPSQEKIHIQPPTEDWTVIRERWTDQAIREGDIPTLRRISALPGGFGGADIRQRAWSSLLHTHRLPENRQVTADDVVDTPDAAQIVQVAIAVQDDEVVDPDSDACEQDSAAGVSPARIPVSAHKDESQVKLDTNRSFVTYPKGIPAQLKLDLQADLQDLIVGVLRKYPALSYFQGYHDILSVLYLTFAPLQSACSPKSSSKSQRNEEKEGPWPVDEEEPRLDGDNKRLAMVDVAENEKVVVDSSLPYQSVSRDSPEWRELRRCAEAVSLHRVRDAMGSGMQGMMGLLRILKRILRAADPKLSQFSAKISPVPTLPFFALSWVLTLFSHDCDSLPPIQRMFDFLLARNPISAVYLAVAILIAKKPQMLRMAEDLGSEYHEDPSLLHPLFVRLPPLYPDTPSTPEPPNTGTVPGTKATTLDDDDPNPYEPIKLSDLFKLTDCLMDQYPWDGEIVKGKDILGKGSVVCSYDLEMGDETWSVENALALIDVEVVKPGVATMDNDEEEADETEPISRRPTRRSLSLRIPRHKLSTMLALGVVILGVGMAVYGVKAGGSEARWGRWWGMVIRGWVGRESKKAGEGWGTMIRFAIKSLGEIV
ncbi:hypothetical protein IAR55_007066 [Kwoniella newhampshirensis]|uniref:Rab-GAP TBC domain-containing protein n=1 Tax=Kwoniella newhampshirensis TaxID=1651941 RepID=A0AAW0YDH4_9TREE